MNEIEQYTEKIFEEIKHIDEEGNEYWEARELMPILEYSKWENFNNVIKKALVAYKNSNNDELYWIPEFRKPIITGKGKKEYIIDYKLSRYICYLIVQNANPKKKMVALGQTYFAIQTRRMELSEKEYSTLTEDEKRLYRRKKLRYREEILDHMGSAELSANAFRISQTEQLLERQKKVKSKLVIYTT